MMPGRGPGHGHGSGHGHGHGEGQGQGCCNPGGSSLLPGGSWFGGLQPGNWSGGGWRRFMSPAEEMERLQDYLGELKKEVAGVEARIHALKGK